MNFERLKFEPKDVIKAITLTASVVGLYFGITARMESMFLEFGFEKKINSDYRDKADLKFEKLEEKTQEHDIKLARIFTMLYKDADKPKKQKTIETETEE